jgi:integration host factor subunit alpha
MSENKTENDTITKAELVQAVYELRLFTKRESGELVEHVFQTLKAQLAQGVKIKLSGFGNFEVRDKKSRKGRNPKTGVDITIEPRRILRFKPSQLLKMQLNQKRAAQR